MDLKKKFDKIEEDVQNYNLKLNKYFDEIQDELIGKKLIYVKIHNFSPFLTNAPIEYLRKINKSSKLEGFNYTIIWQSTLDELFGVDELDDYLINIS